MMKKRVLSALLAAALTLSLATPALALTGREEAAQVLSALDIMTGDENGNLNLSAPVTRAEFVKMLMAASPISVGDVTYVSPYPDVPASHWAAPYVEAAVAAGYVTGYLDGTFRPANTITLAEGVVMALRLLGYTNEDFSGSFPAGQMAMYRTLDLDEGITIGQNDTMSQNDTMTRQDAMYLFYNLLTAPTRTTGQPYLSSVLGYGLTADGEVDALALLNGTMDGPVVVGEAGWKDKIPFDITAAALMDNDVVYWSKNLKALWVYTNKITGPIQAITPASAPTSVTVSGKSYTIETSSAAYALSDLGTFEVGDSVTLLLGRDGKVAAAVAPGESSGGSVCGLVVSNVPQQYTDKNGNDYTAASVTILATDGNTYTYSTDRTSVRTGTATPTPTPPTAPASAPALWSRRWPPATAWRSRICPPPPSPARSMPTAPSWAAGPSPPTWRSWTPTATTASVSTPSVWPVWRSPRAWSATTCWTAAATSPASSSRTPPATCTPTASSPR